MTTNRIARIASGITMPRHAPLEGATLGGLAAVIGPAYATLPGPKAARRRLIPFGGFASSEIGWTIAGHCHAPRWPVADSQSASRTSARRQPGGRPNGLEVQLPGDQVPVARYGRRRAAGAEGAFGRQGRQAPRRGRDPEDRERQ